MHERVPRGKSEAIRQVERKVVAIGDQVVHAAVSKMAVTHFCGEIVQVDKLELDVHRRGVFHHFGFQDVASQSAAEEYGYFQVQPRHQVEIGQFEAQVQYATVIVEAQFRAVVVADPGAGDLEGEVGVVPQGVGFQYMRATELKGVQVALNRSAIKAYHRRVRFQ